MPVPLRRNARLAAMAALLVGGGCAPTGVDVYVAGWESNGTVQVAKVWKNGAAQALSDGTHGALATAIAVSGDDVYVAGGVDGGVAGGLEGVNGVDGVAGEPGVAGCAGGSAALVVCAA